MSIPHSFSDFVKLVEFKATAQCIEVCIIQSYYKWVSVLCAPTGFKITIHRLANGMREVLSSLMILTPKLLSWPYYCKSSSNLSIIMDVGVVKVVFLLFQGWWRETTMGLTSLIDDWILVSHVPNIDPSWGLHLHSFANNTQSLIIS